MWQLRMCGLKYWQLKGGNGTSRARARFPYLWHTHTHSHTLPLTWLGHIARVSLELLSCCVLPECWSRPEILSTSPKIWIWRWCGCCRHTRHPTRRSATVSAWFCCIFSWWRSLFCQSLHMSGDTSPEIHRTSPPPTRPDSGSFWAHPRTPFSLPSLPLSLCLNQTTQANKEQTWTGLLILLSSPLSRVQWAWFRFWDGISPWFPSKSEPDSSTPVCRRAVLSRTAAVKNVTSSNPSCEKQRGGLSYAERVSPTCA